MRAPVTYWVLLLLVMKPVWAQGDHDQKVAAEIKTQLDAAFKAPGEIDLSTRIQLALKKATDKRDKPEMSKDEVLRDAEYYLHGLYGAAAKDWTHITPTMGAPVYNVLKWAALRCRDVGIPELEKLMRTQPGNPISEPGGSAWAYRGLKDGFSLNGKDTVRPRPNGHGLPLPALNAVAPCARLP